MEIDQLYKLYTSSGSVSIDSREIYAGCIYFALKGENFDGNDFALEALAKGAEYAIVDNADLSDEPACILVDDVLDTLQRLAQYYRKQYKGKVLGITGSNGKTTTKELIYSVLSRQASTHVTKGNLNNHIGVPLTLLRLGLDDKYAIIEMGANHQGEIDFLCSIADPEIGIITNIGRAHLEGFGGIEGVKKGKSELYGYIEKREGIVLVNADEQYLVDLVPVNLIRKYYGSGNSAKSLDYLIKSDQFEPTIKFHFTDNVGHVHSGESRMMGEHNFQNIKTAIATGLFLDIEPSDIVEGIRQYIPTINRSQFVKTKLNRIYLDAYNANPDSVKNSLIAFFNMEEDPKVVVLGDMLELGASSLEEHQKIFDFVHKNAPETTFLVGKEFNKINAPDTMKFEDTSALKAFFAQNKLRNAFIFIKASRAMKLEVLMEEL